MIVLDGVSTRYNMFLKAKVVDGCISPVRSSHTFGSFLKTEPRIEKIPCWSFLVLLAEPAPASISGILFPRRCAPKIDISLLGQLLSHCGEQHKEV